MSMSNDAKKGVVVTPKRRFWDRWVVKFVLIIALLYAFRLYQQHGLTGGRAKPLPGETLNIAQTTRDTQRDRSRIIHFWATWCEVCKAMNGNIAALSAEKNVVTVASLSGNAEQVRDYLRDNRLTMPVVVDPRGRLAASYGVNAFPTTMVVDKKGKIRLAEVGYTTEIGLRVRLWLVERTEELSLDRIKRWFSR